MQEVDYYGDPERYDAEYAFLSADTRWYRERVSELGSPALVLGCGTGRLLFHLADAGVFVDGLDREPAMLDQARSRAALMRPEITEKVSFYEGDMRHFSLPHRYRAVVIPLNGLMHLLVDDDVLACLICIRDHLADDGCLLFDVTHPQGEFLENFGGPEGIPVRDIRVRGVTYKMSEHHRYQPDTGISEMLFRYVPVDTDSPPFQCRLRLRLFSTDHLDRLLSLAGFQVRVRLGSFSGSSFRGDSPTQIVEASRKD